MSPGVWVGGPISSSYTWPLLGSGSIYLPSSWFTTFPLTQFFRRCTRSSWLVFAEQELVHLMGKWGLRFYRLHYNAQGSDPPREARRLNGWGEETRDHLLLAHRQQQHHQQQGLTDGARTDPFDPPATHSVSNMCFPRSPPPHPPTATQWALVGSTSTAVVDEEDDYIVNTIGHSSPVLGTQLN